MPLQRSKAGTLPNLGWRFETGKLKRRQRRAPENQDARGAPIIIFQYTMFDRPLTIDRLVINPL